jgi:rhamnosyltransferase subunit B
MTSSIPRQTRVCLVTFGSAGDVHPMLALGQALRSRGWPVTLLTNPMYAQATASAGLEFVAVGEQRHHEETIAHPKLWHPIDGFGVMWRYLLRPALRPTYDRLAELAAAGRCVVIASPVAMGARLAQERLGLPLVTAYTAATMLRTVHDPMTLAHWSVAPWFPRTLRRAAWSLLDRVKLEPLVRPTLDPLRHELGLPPVRESIFGSWMHSPQAGVTLFPSWFAAAAENWPQQVVQAGFPLYDEAWPQGPPSALMEFLQQGKPPVVFMPGTARREGGDFFVSAVRACEQANERGLLLGNVDMHLQRRLPPTIRAEAYLPFWWLLPQARALVHHGGVGSSAQALRAGIPQLVVPHAYDQFDNAMRLRRLGVGRTLPQGARGLDSMGPELKSLLASEQVAHSCRQLAGRATSQAAQEAVAALVERFA